MEINKTILLSYPRPWNNDGSIKGEVGCFYLDNNLEVQSSQGKLMLGELFFEDIPVMMVLNKAGIWEDKWFTQDYSEILKLRDKLLKEYNSKIISLLKY